MKKSILNVGLALGMVMSARAALFSTGEVSGSGTALNLAIPDGNPSGNWSSLEVSGLDNPLASLTVTLNVTGGYNGDLYAYLSYGGIRVDLLNRVGTSATSTGNAVQDAFGYATSGFSSVTLGDGGSSNIHDVQNPVAGTTYLADGGSLSVFQSVNPNGTWTLFLEDKSTGQFSTLDGWSLDLTPVPEPVNVALSVFAATMIGVGVYRRNQARKAKLECPPVAG